MTKPARNRRDVNAELREVIAQGAPWVRRTEFVPMADGSLRRCITRHDSTIEKDEVIDAARVPVAAARAGTGLSQARSVCVMVDRCRQPTACLSSENGFPFILPSSTKAECSRRPSS